MSDEDLAEAIAALDVPLDEITVAGAKMLGALRELSRLREVLRKFGFGTGDIDDELVGWRALGPMSQSHYCCEFCMQSNKDATLLEHAPDCPVTLARAALKDAPNE